MSDPVQNKRKIFLIPNVLSEGTAEQIIPPVVRESIKECRYFFVENVRTTRRYISSLKLGLNIEGLIFFILDKKTTERTLAVDLKKVPEGENIGIISEAGMPAIADPGNLLVKLAHQNGWKVISLPGPSSVLLALTGSGFNGQKFSFHGYLPIQAPKRKRSLKALEEKLKRTGETQIFMETPYRNHQLLEDIFSSCSEGTLLCIASDLTGAGAQIITRSIREWKKQKVALHKVPAMFLIGQ